MRFTSLLSLLSLFLLTASHPRETIFDGTPYVFEGIVLSSTPCLNPQTRNYLFNINLVEIRHIFKGDLKPGTVEILTRGDYFDEVTMTGVSSDHSYNYKPGTIATFMCSTSLYPEIYSVTEPSGASNKIRLKPRMREYEYVRDFNELGYYYYVVGAEGAFPSVEKFYKYLKIYNGLNHPDTCIYPSRKTPPLVIYQLPPVQLPDSAAIKRNMERVRKMKEQNDSTMIFYPPGQRPGQD